MATSPSGSIRSTPGPGLAPSRSVLDNGVVVLVKESRKTPAVALNLAVRAGTICDPPEAGGAMNLLARTIDRGTTTRTAAEIAEEIDSRGVSLSIVATRHLLSIVSTCLAEDFEPVVGMLADIVARPVFPDREVATRKGEVVTAIRQDQDNPAVQAVEGMMALLYGSAHPYGRRIKGTIESVESLTPDLLRALHAARFAPSELSLVIVGDVEAPRALDLAARALGGWRADRPAPVALPTVARARTRRMVVVPMMNKAQADIAYGFTTITRRDPSYYAYWLMNVALGQYALGGRLGDSIRERQGMAYYVGSGFEANVLEGPLQIRAGVGAANVERAIASIDEELARLRHDGLTDKELNESRQWVVGSMPRALETNAGIASFLQTAEFFQLGADYDLRMPELLARVTLEDANAAARALDPGRASIVVAGPTAPAATPALSPGSSQS